MFNRFALRYRSVALHRAGRFAAWLFLVLASTSFLASCGGSSGSGASSSATSTSTGMQGHVMGGRQPVSGATVLAYAASMTVGAAPVQIGQATTDSKGNWSIASFSTTPVAGQLVYIVAMGGDAGAGVNNSSAVLMLAVVVAADGSLPTSVNINELVTVATTAQLQSLITEVDCSTIAGTSITTTGKKCPSIAGASDLATRAATITALVDITTGHASAVLLAAASGSPANITLEKLNFLASLMAACVNSVGGVAGDGSACGELFGVAWTPGTGALTALGSPISVGTGAEPYSVAVSPNGKNAYVANFGKNTVSAFSIGTNGELTALGSPLATDSGPQSVTVSPNGQNVYVANFKSSTVSMYSVGSDGSLAMLGTSVGTGKDPFTVTVSPNGQNAYVTNWFANTISTYSIGSDGTLTALGSDISTSANATNAPAGLAISPDGAYAYAVNQSGADGAVVAFSIGSTGALTALGSVVSAGLAPDAITISPNGKYVYVANLGDSTVSAYSRGTNGTLTAIGAAVSGVSSPTSLVVSPGGQTLYVADEGTGKVSVFSIGSSGALTVVGSGITAGGTPESVAISPNGQYLYVANFSSDTISTYSVSNGTGDTLVAELMLSVNSGNSTLIAALFDLLPLPVVYGPVPTAPPANCTLGGGQYVYVANYYAGSLAEYALTAGTGALTPLADSPLTVGGTISSVRISPNGQFVYVVGSGGIYAYTLDSGSGRLTAVSGSPFTAASTALAMALSPNGQFAYVVNQGTYPAAGSVSAYSINQSTGALTSLGSTVAAGVNALTATVSPGGSTLYVSNLSSNSISAYGIASNGTLTELTGLGSPFATGSNTGPSSLSISPDGHYAYVNEREASEIAVYSIGSNGALTALPGAGVSTGATSVPIGATVSPDGLDVYAVNQSEGTVLTYSIGSGGVLTELGSPTAAGNGPTALAISPDGLYVYAANQLSDNVSAYSVGSTGALTAVGTPLATGGNAFSVAVSP